ALPRLRLLRDGRRPRRHRAAHPRVRPPPGPLAALPLPRLDRGHLPAPRGRRGPAPGRRRHRRAAADRQPHHPRRAHGGDGAAGPVPLRHRDRHGPGLPAALPPLLPEDRARLPQPHGHEQTVAHEIAGGNEKAMKAGVKAKKLAAALERSTDVLVGVAQGAVLVVGSLQVLRGAMSPGDMVLFLTYLKIAMKPLRDMAKYTGRSARAAATGE